MLLIHCPPSNKPGYRCKSQSKDAKRTEAHRPAPSPKPKISGMYNNDAVQVEVFDGCYHDSKTEMDHTSFAVHSEGDSSARLPTRAEPS
ncbi:gamma-aminobutyric acid receptor subunit rho-3 [Manis javanica]|uniref:gamma-aminobutyric acid receptor subunit rho-3 n=1 Tax=Manis javanica TaxID=9974 RepID=UPI00187AF325|nr:gamma-aminobutyric acid receptor subunit rho-3 [Manis javanica]KAI5940302.1 Gamma-aminobutyric acid receptor subunit rho-3 [Manis javanica]